MKNIVGISLLVILLSCCERPSLEINHVNPFIGTDGPGHTYPGVSLPFGMIQLSPDTRLSGWEGCSGYHYSDSIIYGFSHTHLSGTGALDYGDVLLMPTVGDVNLSSGVPNEIEAGYASKFSHENETASPGYYSVYLEDDGILAELTATQRVGYHSYRFPETKAANLIIDLNHRDRVLNSFIRVVSEYEIEGLRRSQSWAADQYVYFVMQFSKPFKDYGLFLDEQIQTGQEVNGGNVKAHFTFTTKRNERIEVKVGISPVSVDGARANLIAEIPGWSFSQVRQKARKTWQTVLRKFIVPVGPKDQLEAFYTAVYHQYLNPNLYMDVDSLYRGRDLLIHKAEGYTNYTLFSLWDTYRATHPLFTLTERQRTTDFIKTFITQYEQGGMLPVWELSANETGTMIGYHSVSVIADAYVKGIRNFNAQKAFDAMRYSADAEHLGLKYYKELGYIPGSEEGESVSKTLEYAYDDWCIAQLARKLGDSVEHERFLKRALSYRNLFDPSSKFMRAKLGSMWFSPFDPVEVNFNYTEANAWQYSFYVPQDIEGLMNLYGGAQGFSNHLDSMFAASSLTTGRNQADITGLIGQYAHGNEPSHHMAYLYNYCGQPWKTQKLVNQIMTELYDNTPLGLCGNEDCGQMSAWYIFSAMGFYPVSPGSMDYIIGTPLFPKMIIQLENGKQIEIIANNRSPENMYIQSLTVNDTPWTKSYISHADLVEGARLVFTMGPEPNMQWAVEAADWPSSSIQGTSIVETPFVYKGDRTFSESTMVELQSIDSTASIYYQIVSQHSVGSNSFRLYTKPIRITSDRKIRFYAEEEGAQSAVMEALFSRLSRSRTIELMTPFANQYAAGGETALIDKIRGARNFRTGAWQGYEGRDVEGKVDLGFNQTVHRIALSCFQDQSYWIFMPDLVMYEGSLNGQDWEQLGQVENSIAEDLQGAFIQEFELDVWKTLRYIRFKAKNRGPCPDWHIGAGGKSWIFADELIIE